MPPVTRRTTTSQLAAKVDENVPVVTFVGASSDLTSAPFVDEQASDDGSQTSTLLNRYASRPRRQAAMHARLKLSGSSVPTSLRKHVPDMVTVRLKQVEENKLRSPTELRPLSPTVSRALSSSSTDQPQEVDNINVSSSTGRHQMEGDESLLLSSKRRTRVKLQTVEASKLKEIDDKERSVTGDLLESEFASQKRNRLHSDTVSSNDVALANNAHHSATRRENTSLTPEPSISDSDSRHAKNRSTIKKASPSEPVTEFTNSQRMRNKKHKLQSTVPSATDSADRSPRSMHTPVNTNTKFITASSKLQRSQAFKSARFLSRTFCNSAEFVEEDVVDTVTADDDKIVPKRLSFSSQSESPPPPALQEQDTRKSQRKRQPAVENTSASSPIRAASRRADATRIVHLVKPSITLDRLLVDLSKASEAGIEAKVNPVGVEDSEVTTNQVQNHADSVAVAETSGVLDNFKASAAKSDLQKMNQPANSSTALASNVPVRISKAQRKKLAKQQAAQAVSGGISKKQKNVDKSSEKPVKKLTVGVVSVVRAVKGQKKSIGNAAGYKRPSSVGAVEKKNKHVARMLLQPMPSRLLARSSADLLDVRPILSSDGKWLVAVSSSSHAKASAAAKNNTHNAVASSVVKLYNTVTGKLIVNLMPPSASAAGKKTSANYSPIIDMHANPLNSSQIYFLHANGAMWWYDVDDEIAVVERPVINKKLEALQKLHAFHIAVNGQFYLVASLPAKNISNGACLYAVDRVDSTDDLVVNRPTEHEEETKSHVKASSARQNLRWLILNIDTDNARSANVAFDRRAHQCRYVVALGGDRLLVRNLDTNDEADPARRFRAHVIGGGGGGGDNGYNKQLRRLTCVASHPAQECVATGDSTGAITLWYNFRYGNAPVRTQVHWHMLPVEDLVFGGRLGTQLFSAGHEAVLCRWLVAASEKEQLKFLPRLGAPIRHLIVPVDAAGDVAAAGEIMPARVAVCHYDNEIKLVDYASWKVVSIVRPFLRNYLNSANYVGPLMQRFTLKNDTETSKRHVEDLLSYPAGLRVDPRTLSLVTNATPGHLQFYSLQYDESLLNLDVGGMSLLTATAAADAVLKAVVEDRDSNGNNNEEKVDANLLASFASKLNAEVVQAEFDGSGEWLVTVDEWLPEDFLPVVHLNIWTRKNNDDEQDDGVKQVGGGFSFRRHATVSTPHYGEAESYRIVRMQILSASSTAALTTKQKSHALSTAPLVATLGEDCLIKLWATAHSTGGSAASPLYTWSCVWQQPLPLPERLRSTCFSFWRRQMSPFTFFTTIAAENAASQYYMACAVNRTVYVLDAFTGMLMISMTDLLPKISHNTSKEDADYFLNISAVVAPNTAKGSSSSTTLEVLFLHEVLLFITSLKTTLVVKLTVPREFDRSVSQIDGRFGDDDKKVIRYSVLLRLPMSESRLTFDPLSGYFVLIGRQEEKHSSKKNKKKIKSTTDSNVKKDLQHQQQQPQQRVENVVLLGNVRELYTFNGDGTRGTGNLPVGCSLMAIPNRLVGRPITHAVFVPNSTNNNNTSSRTTSEAEKDKNNLANLIKRMQSCSTLVFIDPKSQTLLQMFTGEGGVEALNSNIGSADELHSTTRTVPDDDDDVAVKDETDSAPTRMAQWKQADTKSMFTSLLSRAREKAVTAQSAAAAAQKNSHVVAEQPAVGGSSWAPLHKIFDFMPAYAMPSMQSMLSLAIGGDGEQPLSRTEKTKLHAADSLLADNADVETSNSHDGVRNEKSLSVASELFESYDQVRSKYSIKLLTNDDTKMEDGPVADSNNNLATELEKVIDEGLRWMKLD